MKTDGFQTFLSGYPVAETTGNNKFNYLTEITLHSTK